MLDKKRLLEIMLTARESDLRELSLLKQGKGWFHVGGMGHEGLACLSLLLRDDDVISTHYRDKAIVLARGLGVDYFARAYYGKRDSYSRGRQMLGHYSWRPRNIWSMPSPTPSHLLPACGIAWAMKLQGKTSLSVACLGDGGARQGEFFESMAFAVERKLPLLLVVEDNHFAISTDTRKMNPLHLGMLDESRVTQVNGRDVDALAAAFRESIEHIRTGRGPRIVWCDLDRLSSHTSSDDHSGYRSAEEIESEQRSDVLQVSMNRMVDQKAMQPRELEVMRQQVSAHVAQAYADAESLSNPQRDDLFPELLGPAPTPQPISLLNSQRERMADAVNGFFHQAMDRDDRVVFFGEDIEDPKGGVFRLTKGLSTKFPQRVFNSPLAEATILGVACGMASYGMRPIFELQFIDFVGPGWNQLVNNLATLRWRSDGQWNCPAVIYAPCGAYLPGGGMWHSQAGGSPLAQHPGLRVAIPSTPDDAAGIFQTALAGEDPTIILLPKHLLWKRVTVDGPADPVGFGQARVAREGTDITVVTWGNCIEVAEAAADELGTETSLEIIDLRTVVPWDQECVANSLKKTGRLLVVQEERESCSLGQMIISWVTTNQATWDTLLCQPQLLSKPDIYVGFQHEYEWNCLPTSARVIQRAREMLTY